MKNLFILFSVVLIAGCQSVTGPAVILKPVKICEDVKVPIYGVLDRPSSTGEVVAGASRKREKVIVDYKTEYQCRTEYK